jgi:hypothetical protein
MKTKLFTRKKKSTVTALDITQKMTKDLEHLVAEFDPVNKPAHYNMGGIECIDYIKQVLGLDGFISYCHGNMIKYQHRYRFKTKPLEDMQKAEWYLNKMNAALKEKHK